MNKISTQQMLIDIKERFDIRFAKLKEQAEIAETLSPK